MRPLTRFFFASDARLPVPKDCKAKRDKAEFGKAVSAACSACVLAAVALMPASVFRTQALTAAQAGTPPGLPCGVVSPCPFGNPDWNVHPTTTDDNKYTAGAEETFYVGDVYVRLVRPAGDDKMPLPPSGVPVILMFSPYSSGFTTTADAATLFGVNPDDPFGGAMSLARFFVPRGYAMALADVPGTGNSGGCWDMLGSREQAAGYELVEYLGTRDWSNGKVGMIGISYPGGAAVMTAVSRPPHLATIVVEFAPSSVYEVLYHDGVRYSLEGAYGITSLDNPPLAAPAAFDFFFGLLPPSNPADASYGANLLERACIETRDKLTHTQYGYELEPEFDSFWRQRNWIKDAAMLAAPAPGTGQEVSVLVSGGWTDEVAKSPHQTRWFDAVPVDDPTTATDEGVPFKMLVMGNRGHGFQSPEFRDARLLHAWFDRFLYGFDTNIEKQLPVWSKANDQVVRGEERWPMRGTEPANLFLQASGQLTSTPSNVAPPSVSELLGTYFDSGLESDSQVFAVRQASGVHFLWFETEPLRAQIRLAGAPSLKLLASTSTASTHFTPVLFDLGPQSESSLFKIEGNQECELLEEQEVCILSRGFLNTRFKGGLDDGEDLIPDTPYKASVRLIDKDWVIEAGHRIGLAVMSSNTGFAVSDQQRAVNSLLSRRGARSRVELPVVGGETALKQALDK